MTSQINFGGIDAAYPVAGEDNDSQGFRNNFTVIKDNFQTAYNEISGLQATSIQANAVNTLNANTFINGGVYNASERLLYDNGSINGAVLLDYSFGTFQTMTLVGSTVIGNIDNWPVAGTATSMTLEVVVDNTGWTLTFPSTVTLGYTSIANINDRTVTFTETGTYVFQFSSVDGGSNIMLRDLTRNRGVVQGNLVLQSVVSNVTVTPIAFTITEVGGQAQGTITADYFVGNVITVSSNSGSFTGNVTAGNLIANVGIYGNIQTAIQSNITGLGVLTSLQVSGNANVGNLTTTGITDMCGGSAYGLQYITATQSGSETILSNVGLAVVEAAANISLFSLTMPATPMNGQAIKIVFGSNTITSLSHVATGGAAILSALTTVNVAGGSYGGEWVYYNSGTKAVWYRVA